MKIKDCLVLGSECGMETVGQCIDNVEIHSTGLFRHPKIQDELQDMYEGLYCLLEDMDIESEDDILTEQALEFLNEK